MLRLTLASLPAQVATIVSWYGPGTPGCLPANVVVVRPRRHRDNYMRGYVLNVAIRSVQTPYVLLCDADMLFPRFFFDVLEPDPNRVLRFYVGRATEKTTQMVSAGASWQDLYADYQGCDNRIFRMIYGAHNPCLYPTEVLHRIHGYDERMIGWGREDDDLTDRTRRIGMRDVRVPVLVIALDDAKINDYAAYSRGAHTRDNNTLWRSTRSEIANAASWGDGGRCER